MEYEAMPEIFIAYVITFGWAIVKIGVGKSG